MKIDQPITETGYGQMQHKNDRQNSHLSYYYLGVNSMANELYNRTLVERK